MLRMSMFIQCCYYWFIDNELYKNPKFLPCVLMVIYVFTAWTYFVNGDWRKVLYWLSATVLNITVTF